MGGPNLSMEGALFKVVPGPLTSVIKHKILGGLGISVSLAKPLNRS